MAGVTGALFGRDESRILSWSEDKTVRLWDVATGRQIGPAMTHDGPVLGALLQRATRRASCRGPPTRPCGCGTPPPAARSARL